MKTLTQSRAGWQSYTESRSPEVREALILQYMPLVRRIAGRLLGSLPRSVRLEDLVSAGIVGLLSSLENFDTSLGTKFETFAVNRIRGAMLDSLRELDWVPRSIRQKARRLEKAMEEVAQKLGHLPEDEEVAAGLNVPLEEYFKMLDEVNVAVLLSLDDPFPNPNGNGVCLSEMTPDSEAPSSQERVEEMELRETLVNNLRSLPEQEKLVLALYYYEELTYREIGAILRLTESRVSQIHSKAVLKLRTAVRQRMNR